MPRKPPVIAVFGSSGITQESEAAHIAERAGHLLATAGFVVCNGGYMGAMEACSRGAFATGGKIIGVTCEAFRDRSPNPYLTEEISTPDLNERIATLMRISDGYIVLDGMIGTLAELFLAWNLVYMGDTKPLLVVGEPLRKTIAAIEQHTEVSAKHVQHLIFCPTVDDAVSRLQSFFASP